MRQILVNHDRYGYSIGVDDVTGKTVAEIESMVAGYHNRKPGYIENLSGSWSVEEAEDIAAVQKREDISDCAVAWSNGQNRCQCFNPECPRYGID